MLWSLIENIIDIRDLGHDVADFFEGRGNDRKRSDNSNPPRRQGLWIVYVIVAAAAVSFAISVIYSDSEYSREDEKRAEIAERCAKAPFLNICKED